MNRNTTHRTKRIEVGNVFLFVALVAGLASVALASTGTSTIRTICANPCAGPPLTCSSGTAACCCHTGREDGHAHARLQAIVKIPQPAHNASNRHCVSCFHV